ncbi:MAG: aminopeptidase, partial [Bryobacteraceae bacterium]
MDRRRQAVVAGLTVGLMCACGGSPAGAPAPDSGNVARRLRADLEFLASDLLEGRGTPGRGLDIAAAYLEAELRSVGVEPTANSGYRQPYT